MKRSWPTYFLTFFGMMGLLLAVGWVRQHGVDVEDLGQGGAEAPPAWLNAVSLLLILLGVHCVAMFAATPSWRRRVLYVTRVPWSLAQAVLFLLALVLGPQVIVLVVLGVAEGFNPDEHGTSGAPAEEQTAVIASADEASGDETSRHEVSGDEGAGGETTPETESDLRTYMQFAIPVISAAILAALVVGMRSRGRQAWRAFGFGRAGLWRNIGIGVVAYLAFRWAILPVLETSVAAVFDLLGQPIREHEAISEYREAGSSLVRIAIMLTIMFTAPVFEEIAFRGVLFQTIKRYAGSVAAIGLSALVFAVLHPGAFVIVNIFFLGLLFGYLFDKTGSIVPGIVLHFLFNATTMVALMLVA